MDKHSVIQRKLRFQTVKPIRETSGISSSHQRHKFFYGKVSGIFFKQYMLIHKNNIPKCIWYKFSLTGGNLIIKIRPIYTSDVWHFTIITIFSSQIHFWNMPSGYDFYILVKNVSFSTISKICGNQYIHLTFKLCMYRKSSYSLQFRCCEYIEMYAKLKLISETEAAFATFIFHWNC